MEHFVRRIPTWTSSHDCHCFPFSWSETPASIRLDSLILRHAGMCSARQGTNWSHGSYSELPRSERYIVIDAGASRTRKWLLCRSSALPATHVVLQEQRLASCQARRNPSWTLHKSVCYSGGLPLLLIPLLSPTSRPTPFFLFELIARHFNIKTKIIAEQ